MVEVRSVRSLLVYRILCTLYSMCGVRYVILSALCAVFMCCGSLVICCVYVYTNCAMCVLICWVVCLFVVGVMVCPCECGSLCSWCDVVTYLICTHRKICHATTSFVVWFGRSGTTRTMFSVFMRPAHEWWCIFLSSSWWSRMSIQGVLAMQGCTNDTHTHTQHIHTNTQTDPHHTHTHTHILHGTQTHIQHSEPTTNSRSSSLRIATGTHSLASLNTVI